MYKVPLKHKKSIAIELKKFEPVVKNLQAKGKSSSEDDARIVLNDLLSYALGYDKYNELKTEYREKNGRFDYVVKLSEGPNSKKENFDFVIEAKAVHVQLNQSHVDQTLTYCLQASMDWFILTNVTQWQLYYAKRTKKESSAIKVFELDFGTEGNFENLVDEFYLFSKNAYLAGDWKSVRSMTKATKVEDVVAVLLSDKILKSVTKELSSVSGVKISIDRVKDIIENQIVKSSVDNVNKRLTKKINESRKRKITKTEDQDSQELANQVPAGEAHSEIDIKKVS